MNDWVKKYTEIADKFNEFGKTFGKTGFKRESQVTENFALMCIKLCREDASTIALLLILWIFPAASWYSKVPSLRLP